MSIHHHILSLAYQPVRLTRMIAQSLGVCSANSLRVLLFHDIAPHQQANFAKQLRWLARTWTFVTPKQFGSMVSGEEPIRGLNLLLTFDDGFASNRVVAEKILNPMGIRALFFVVSDFVSLTNIVEVRHFITNHISSGMHVDDIPAHLYNMRWEDLDALLEQGHCVGGHTRTHARLSQINSGSDLVNEIIASADVLENRLGVPIEHFAYTFGDLASFSKEALAIARQRFRFVYSGLRGDNSKIASPLALRRDAISPDASKALLGAITQGVADFCYSKARSQLDGWI